MIAYFLATIKANEKYTVIQYSKPTLKLDMNIKNSRLLIICCIFYNNSVKLDRNTNCQGKNKAELIFQWFLSFLRNRFLQDPALNTKGWRRQDDFTQNPNHKANVSSCRLTEVNQLKDLPTNRSETDMVWFEFRNPRFYFYLSFQWSLMWPTCILGLSADQNCCFRAICIISLWPAARSK